MATQASDQPADPSLREARFQHSASFPEVLRQMRCSLLVSTYQAGQLVAIGLDVDGKVSFSFHGFDQAMGVAAIPSRLAVGTKGQVWFLTDNSALAGDLEPKGQYDRCFLPRSAIVTGGIHCHEMAWGTDLDGNPELWVVNTLFSSLCTLHPDYSFVPRWRPPFVTELVAEDRCHLNGLAMADGRPSVVTVMALTNKAGAWREDRNRTGTVLDVGTGEVVTRGLAMPHSPRWHAGRLYVLNSGMGALEVVDPDTGRRDQVAAVPGYSRGLACHGNLAFVGLSRIRETHIFGGVPIARHHDELKCGVGVVDLETGSTVATLEFSSGVEEIFDVQVLPETRCVALAGQRPEEEDQIWVVPPESGATALGPAEAIALNSKGNDLQEAGDKQRALECYQRAVQIDPGCAPALQNLGYLTVSQGLTEQGIRRLEQAQNVKPEVMTEVMIATALPVIYDAPGDVAAWRERTEQGVQELVDRGAEIDTTDYLLPTNFFCAYQGRNDRALHENLGRIYKGPDLTEGRPRRERGPDDRIRVGILSAYFRNHTVGGLNIGRVERIDPERFEVVLLSIGRYDDRTAQRYQATPHRFVELPGGVAETREAIAAEDLDVLFFTEVGMNSLAYTLAFSRMAPVQCVTWGHPVTTGSPYMDDFLSSDLLEVPDADDHYTERLVRPPTLCTYYERPDQPDASGIWGDLGLEADHNLYACPQTLFKFHPDFDRIVGEILRRDPTGRLVLMEGGSPEWMRLLHARFARSIGDVSDRIVWLRSQPRPNYLRLLAAADVILDTTVFGGGNSSYEALGVGTPVVTLPSEFLRCRITAALYAKAGFVDLVADSEESYIEMAVRLGTDDEWHRHVSERIEQSCEVLYEDEREVRDFEGFLAEVAL